MKIAKYVEIKSAVGQRAALLSPKADALKEVYPDNHLNAESTLEFMLPANSPKIAELTPECQIWAAGRVYTLLREQAVETVRDEKNTLWSKFVATEIWKELESSYIEPSLSNDPLSPIPSDLAVIIVGGGFNLTGGLYQTGTAAHALYAVLQGSDWTMGTCDVIGIHDLEMEKESRLTLIKEIQNIWGGYLVWDSVNKIVHLRNANLWQNYTGFQIRYRKNLKHITRTQSNKLVTKMYAFGHDDLDIASVNGGVKYLTNKSYSTRDLTGIYKNQDIYDATELMEKASDELALNCHPRYKYTVKMVDLRTLPEYEHEDFSVGDMADVVDADVAPDSPRPRIIRHKYNLFKPWECDIELGDPIERLEEQLKASFGTTGFVGGIFNGNGQSSGASIEDLTITNAKIHDLSADKITAGTITATISITSPIINGGVITGSELNGGIINGGTITGAIINGGIINVQTDVNVGDNINLGNVNSTEEKNIIFYNNTTTGTSSRIKLNTNGALSIQGYQALYLGEGGGTQIELSEGEVKLHGSVTGLESSTFVQPNHNHGIANGTILAKYDAAGNITGYVQWASSGGFSHDHYIY